MDPRFVPHTERVIKAEIDRASRENALEPKRPKERVAMTDQKALLNLDIRRVLANEVEFYDPPERPPR
jgi:hypothetical protein